MSESESTDVREVMALALALYHGDTDNEDVPRASAYTHQADAILAALADAGWPLDDDHVVVPREPTDAMVEAAAKTQYAFPPSKTLARNALRAALHTPGETKE